jgi:FAD/FMN-containing dehydrogenase
LETLLEADKPLINTGVLSQSPAQFSSLWALREGITEAVSKEGKAYKYDISVPLSTFKEVVDATRHHLESRGLMTEGAVRFVIGYGHVGDGKSTWPNCEMPRRYPLGNLHLNVIADAYTPEIQAALEPFVYELVGMLSSTALWYTMAQVIPSVLQRICIRRTWHRCHEDPCSSLFKE